MPFLPRSLDIFDFQTQYMAHGSVEVKFERWSRSWQQRQIYLWYTNWQFHPSLSVHAPAGPLKMELPKPTIYDYKPTNHRDSQKRH